MASRKKEKSHSVVQQTNEEIHETTINEETYESFKEAKSLISVKSRCDNVLTLIKEGKKEEARKELEIAYSIDSNYPYIYLYKLFLKYNFRSFNELKRDANSSVISSSFFKACYELADTHLKEQLSEIIDEVEYKEVEINLESADIEQLLKHLRFQKQKKVDYTYTISLILGILYRAFRQVDKEFIDQNLSKDNFIPVLKKTENNFQYYVDILYHFDDIHDIKDIVNQSIKEHKQTKTYLLLPLRLLIKNTEDQEKLLEIKEYLELAYDNHEADELLEMIRPKIKKTPVFNLKKSLFAGGVSLLLILSSIGLAVGLSQSASNGPVTINGVTYTPNTRNGYSISSYDFLSDTVTFENEINGRQVNRIESGIFSGTDIRAVINFPQYIEDIPDGSFEGCQMLETFNISSNSSLQTISQNAFKDCIHLTTFEVPSNVEYIGNNAFLNTPELIYLSKTTPYDFDEERIGLTERRMVVDVDGEYTFESTFYNWEDIHLPLGERYSFDFVGYEINSDSTDLKTERNEEGDSIVFNGYGYTSIEAQGTFETAGYFEASNGVSYQLSNDKTYYTIVSYDEEANENNEEVTLLTSINDVPVLELSGNAFQNKPSLKVINNLSAEIREIPNNSFMYCFALESINFVGTPRMTRIGDFAFFGCTELNNLTLPSTITQIGRSAFYGCTNLVNFNSTYDFGEGEEAIEEFRRIGFEERNYVINFDNNTQEVGTYFTPQRTITLNAPLRDLTRAVAIDQFDNVFVFDYQSEEYELNVEGYSEITISLVYEPYIPEQGYILQIVSDNEYEAIYATRFIYLSSEVRPLGGSKINNSDFRFRYEIVTTDSFYLFEAEIDGDILIVTKLVEGSLSPVCVGVVSYLVGRYSNEDIMVSSVSYFYVHFI